jgi:hypothetical protein
MDSGVTVVVGEQQATMNLRFFFFSGRLAMYFCNAVWKAEDGLQQR